jgi:hypothetical protein
MVDATGIESSKAPIFIFGAARSGTKVLRGIFAAHPEVTIFPSEIDFIWRFGNENWPNDELGPDLIRPGITQHIRKQFKRWSERNRKARVLDKTCANALRLEFVYEVFPNGYFIHLIRDGRAVTESAMRRWQRRPEPSYYLQKLRGIRVRDALYYAPSYVRYHLAIARSHISKRRLPTWGPRFAGLDELVTQRTLIEVCSVQWAKSVQAAIATMRKLPPAQTIEVRYEELVRNPTSIACQVLKQVGLSFLPECKQCASHMVHSHDIHKWRDRFSKQDLDLLMSCIGPELEQFSYID